MQERALRVHTRFIADKNRSYAANSADNSGLLLFFWETSGPYTTLCKPSVFSISSITPSVATIMMVASAAMVGSK